MAGQVYGDTHAAAEVDPAGDSCPEPQDSHAAEVAAPEGLYVFSGQEKGCGATHADELVEPTGAV